METIGQAAITGTSSIQATVGGASSQSALGNASMGNLAFDQVQLAPNRTSAFMRNWQDDRTGDTYSTNAFGREAVSLLSNSGFASRTVSRSISSSDVDRSQQGGGVGTFRCGFRERGARRRADVDFRARGVERVVVERQ